MREPRAIMEAEGDTRYEIRQATPADVAELVRMQTALQESTDEIRCNLLRLHAASGPRLCEYYLARIQDEQTRLLIAQTAESAQAVGMGTGRIWLHADYLPPRSGEMVDVWVDPEHRRRNLARRIVTGLLQFFKANGIEFLVTNYVHGNAPAEGLWRKLGFEPVLLTATTHRVKAETSLGLQSRRIVPSAYRSVLAGSENMPAMSG